VAATPLFALVLSTPGHSLRGRTAMAGVICRQPRSLDNAGMDLLSESGYIAGVLVILAPGAHGVGARLGRESGVVTHIDDTAHGRLIVTIDGATVEAVRATHEATARAPGVVAAHPGPGSAGGTALPSEPPFELSDKRPGQSQRLPRTREGQAPLVPHSLKGLVPITAKSNASVRCHKRAGATSGPAPASHFVNGRDPSGTTLTQVAGARWNGTACHVPQTGAPPFKSPTVDAGPSRPPASGRG